jgi:RNA polymerase sigma factor (sigma-70 family)
MGDGKVGQGHWTEMVGRIQSANQSTRDAGMTELYRQLSKGVRRYLISQLGYQDTDDRVHEIFMIVVGAILKGNIREPDRLTAFVRAVVKTQMVIYIRIAMQDRKKEMIDNDLAGSVSSRDPSPERLAIDRQQAELARRIISALKKRPHEVLMRFYVREQKMTQICREMDLTPTQFRLMKNRTLMRLKKLGPARLALHHWTPL